MAAMTHELKYWPEYFKDIWSRQKCFEIRENDRDFKIGDVLQLREYDPHSKQYGRVTVREVVYITDYANGLRDGYVCMGLR